MADNLQTENWIANFKSMRIYLTDKTNPTLMDNWYNKYILSIYTSTGKGKSTIPNNLGFPITSLGSAVIARNQWASVFINTVIKQAQGILESIGSKDNIAIALAELMEIANSVKLTGSVNIRYNK